MGILDWLFRPTTSGSTTACSPEEWGAMLARVWRNMVGAMGATAGLNESVDGMPSLEEIALLRKMVIGLQDLPKQVASCRPQAAALQRAHAELLHLTEVQIRWAQALLRHSELATRVEQSGYGRQHLGEYLKAERQLGQAISDQNAALVLFDQAMTELAKNDKALFERLGLTDDFKLCLEQ